MVAPNALVSAMVDAIENGKDHRLLVEEELRASLSGIVLFEQAKDKMLLGYKGMPRTSKKLVTLGVYVIEGEYVCLHRDIYKALKKKDAKRDRLLERLIRANKGESLTEQELAEFA